MNRLLCCLGLLFLGGVNLWAQSATPAVPVDPHQAMPAQPVESNLPVPPAPAISAIPATSATTTNAPATAEVPVAISIVADSSLKQVLQELVQNWADSQDNAPQVPLTLTNAGTERAKVESGTVWDVVISADVQDMKEMTDQGALSADGQRSLARNTLMIYGRKALLKDDELDWFDMVGSEWKKVALGNPDLVASGRVAKRALMKHDLFDDDHKGIYVMAPTETLALGKVEAEEADAVFVYKTDLVGINLPGFTALPLATVDAPPVFYTAAVSSHATNPVLAHAFIDYCSSEAAKAIWAKYGFETN